MQPVPKNIRMLQNLTWIIAFLMFAAAWGMWKFQYASKEKVKVNQLRITTTTPPQGSNYLPEQRRKYALDYEKKLKAAYRDVTITTTGDFHKTLLMKGDVINEQFALQMKDTVEAIKEFRDMGFKRLVMTDGRTAWDVDLEN